MVDFYADVGVQLSYLVPWTNFVQHVACIIPTTVFVEGRFSSVGDFLSPKRSLVGHGPLEAAVYSRELGTYRQQLRSGELVAECSKLTIE